MAVVQENAQAEPAGYRLPPGLAQRQALREEIRKGLAQLQAEGRSYYHPAEPEARRMKVGDTNRYAYNAQAVVDEKAGVVVACEVGRLENDTGQLVPMIEQARENLGTPAAALTVTVADSGYGYGADLQAAADQGLNVLAPPPEEPPQRDPPYAIQHFAIDAAAGRATCPQGRALDYQGYTIKNGRRVERFRCHHRDCPVRAHCTQDPKARQIEVRQAHEVVAAMRQRLQQAGPRQQWQQRRRIIEPRFAQLKQHDGFRRWTVWGLEGVRTQWSLLCATLNLRVLWKKWRASRPGAPRSAAVPVEKLGTVLRILAETALGGYWGGLRERAHVATLSTLQFSRQNF